MFMWRNNKFARFCPSWVVNILSLFSKKLAENTAFCKFPVTAEQLIQMYCNLGKGYLSIHLFLFWVCKKCKNIPTWFIIQILGIFLLIVLSFANTTTTVMFVIIPEEAIIICKTFMVLNFPELSSLFMTSVTFSFHIACQLDQGTSCYIRHEFQPIRTEKVLIWP